MKIFLSFCVILCSGLSYAQDNDWNWPIKSKSLDRNILYIPNDYIDNELNDDALFITGEEGDEIIAPVSGTISFLSYCYSPSLKNGVCFRQIVTNDWDKDIQSILYDYTDENYDAKYISIMLCLHLEDNSDLILTGIRSTHQLKTGQKIEKGEYLGRLGYVYYKIAEPTLRIEVTYNGKAIDPVAPFGLKSTFKTTETNYPATLSRDEALDDINVFVKMLEECYPGLFDYCDENTWNLTIKNAVKKIDDNITFEDFYKKVLTNLVDFQKDNHLAIKTALPNGNNNNNDFQLPPVVYGFIDDTLRIVRTSNGYDHLLKTEVKFVNNISADSLKKKILRQSKSDGLTESSKQLNLASMVWYYDNANEFTLNFADGTTEYFTVKKIGTQKKKCCKNGYTYYNQNWQYFILHNSQRLSLKNIDANTAYIGLYTFYLTETEMDDIKIFIKELQNKNIGNLIIDLRNNNGGEADVCGRLFSYFSNGPFLLSEYDFVKKTKGFQTIVHCTNLDSDNFDLNRDGHFVPWNDGFRNTNFDTLFPDSTVHFPGKIYVLANESTLSAATLFSRLIQHYKRGVIVGRETGNVFSQMNATKFANLILPNSKIEIVVPLIKTVFDSKVPDSINGRGVMPDYPIKLSLQELSATEELDTVINYTLSLIQRNKYIIENNNIQNAPNDIDNKLRQIAIFVLPSVLCLMIIMIIWKIWKKKS
ncbi:MAG: S41 family peptidase [Bacteroidales bacterium]|nr:S41 family peptidase [Bacteroidales bacterium]